MSTQVDTFDTLNEAFALLCELSTYLQPRPEDTGTRQRNHQDYQARCVKARDSVKALILAEVEKRFK